MNHFDFGLFEKRGKKIKVMWSSCFSWNKFRVILRWLKIGGNRRRDAAGCRAKILTMRGANVVGIYRGRRGFGERGSMGREEAFWLPVSGSGRRVAFHRKLLGNFQFRLAQKKFILPINHQKIQNCAPQKNCVKNFFFKLC